MSKSPKQKYPKGRGKCIFCGEFGVSKEHVFPKWLEDLFPRDEYTTHTFGTISPSRLIGISHVTEKKRQGHSGTIKVKVVCKSCNNGWLSRLETNAKPILIPLINNERCGLNMEMQMTVSTWAAKTAMTAEQKRPREGGIGQDERAWLKDHLTPPLYWNVWLASYRGESWWNLAMHQNRIRLRAPPINRTRRKNFYIHSTTFGIGSVVFLVVGTNWKHAPEILRRIDRNGLFRVCPAEPRSILWPPAETLGDPDVDALANILNQSRTFSM